MYDTMITVTGRLTADPVLRQTKGGGSMTTFRIATNGRRSNPDAPGGYENGPTSYYDVVAFRFLGANSAFALHRGDPVVIQGTLEIKEFTRADGTKGSNPEIKARSVGHDLSWGVTAFRKAVRSSGATSEAQVSEFRGASEAAGLALADLAEGRVTVDEFGTPFDPSTGEVPEDFVRVEDAEQPAA